MLKASSRLIFAFTLIISLAFNVLFFASSAVYSLVATSLETVAGLRNPLVHSADNMAEMTQAVDEQKRVNKALKKDLAEKQTELITERRLKREVRSQLAEATAQLAVQKAARSKLKAEVGKVTGQVSKRVAKSAQRKITVAAGESVPAWGIAVIAAVTAIEVNDLCQTAKDMNSLNAILDPSSVPPEDALTACGYQVPSRGELMAAAASAPEKAWAASTEALPSLEDVKGYQLPELSIEAAKTTLYDWQTSLTEMFGDQTQKISNWWYN